MKTTKFKFIVVASVAATTLVGCSNSNSSTSTPSETAANPQASPSTGTVAFADCAAAKFGSDLTPVNPPANVHKYSGAPAMTINPSKLYQATITTKAGTIVLCLQPELAPMTVNNFVTLTRNKFYNGLTFHRVEPGFVIQGGDPTGTGSSGPGYQFNDEAVRAPYVDGAVAMANSGPNTNGSQFFIDIADNTQALSEPLYNVFGKVETGLDVAKKVQKGDVMTSVTVKEQT